jgi:putative transcriptional regulator
MEMATHRYHYEECGLDNVFLENGFRRVSTPRGEGVKIQDVEGLHKVIGLTLIDEKKDLTGAEFRFLRHEMGMTQQSLADLIGVDVQRVARWEKGRNRKIDGAAQSVIRLLFREFAGEDGEIAASLRRIAELDEYLCVNDLVLEDTGEGWQPALAA